MLVDTHVHLIASDKREFPLNRFSHPGNEWIESAPDVSEYLQDMEKAGVSKALLVQPHAAYQTDNNYICSAAANHETIFPIAIVNPSQSIGAQPLSELVRRGVVGLRLFSIPTPAESWLASPTSTQLWKEARKQNLVMGICALPSEISEIGKCAQMYKSQTIVIDHCAFAPIADNKNPATKALFQLAAFPNVVLKVTTLVIDEWVRRKRKPSGQFTLLAESFGPDRLVWGSDFAQTKDRTYQQLVDLGIEAMSSLGSSAVSPMYLNAKRIWKLEE